MNNKKANRKGFFLITIGLLLIAAALCLTGYNLWDEKRAAESVESVTEQMKNEIITEESAEQPAYILNPDMEMPQKTIDGWDYIGILKIPSLGLELPIISECSYPALKVSPCRYLGSAYKDDFIIAAHNYASHFAGLKELAMGEIVLFTDMDGNEFQYEVVERETLMPTAVKELESGDWDLTLFTCTIGGQYRVVVRCEKI